MPAEQFPNEPSTGHVVLSGRWQQRHPEDGDVCVNGAESLLAAMTRNGIDVCFANPGTSELHFVAALDRTGGMRCVLGLFEGVLTGAADGYARMADRPTSTLLHLGPGLANGLSKLHNAMRAHSPIVFIIGDPATTDIYTLALHDSLPRASPSG